MDFTNISFTSNITDVNKLKCIKKKKLKPNTKNIIIAERKLQTDSFDFTFAGYVLENYTVDIELNNDLEILNRHGNVLHLCTGK